MQPVNPEIKLKASTDSKTWSLRINMTLFGHRTLLNKTSLSNERSLTTCLVGSSNTGSQRVDRDPKRGLQEYFQLIAAFVRNN